MSDNKISNKPVEIIPKMSDVISENHKIITMEHELHIKG